MVEKKRKKKIRIRYLLGAVVLVYIGTIFVNQHNMIKELEKERQKKELEIQQLENEISDIQGKIEYTDSLEYIERIAREELGMVKPEEIIYIDEEKSKNKFVEGIGE